MVRPGGMAEQGGPEDPSPSVSKRAAAERHGMPTMSKKPKLTKTEKYKPPTVEELHSLKETEILYQTSIFTLQMEELCSEVEVKEKLKKSLFPKLKSLEEMLTGLPPLTIPDASKPEESLPKNVKLPLRRKKTQLKGELKFVKPTEVKVVGSYLLGTCVNNPLVIDMAVRIPTECLQPKDYLNLRYHHKRALYCTYLVKHLKKRKELVGKVSYGLLHGDHAMPVILVKLLGKEATVRLIPCLAEGSFKEARFSPSKSNIRQQWYSKDCEEETFPSTPLYNASILRDMLYERHLHYLYNASHDFPAFKEAILLLKVWLHQRQFDKTCDGLSGFLASMLVAHLMDIGKLNKVMKGRLIFKNVLHYIATTDWSMNGVSLCRGQHSAERPSLKEFHQHFPVVLVDPSGFLNLCANMTAASYQHLKYEAELSLRILDDKTLDCFQCLFMTPVPFVRKFDHLFTLSKLSQLRSAVKRFGLETTVMDWAGNYPMAALPRVVELLGRALGDRVSLMAVQLGQTTEWPVNAAPPKMEDQGPLTFGLLLNGSLASSVLDKGPAANTSEAKDFSEFWGSKSELRRFQDGSICEAVVWPGASVAEKRLVCSHIVTHILQLHAGIKPETISYTGGQLDPILHQPHPHPSPGVGDGSVEGEGQGSLRTGEEEHGLISAAYTKLSRHLRGLKDLPLTISSVQGTSPAFRHTEVHPPVPGCPAIRLKMAKPFLPVSVPSPDKQCPAWVPAFKVVCHLESSGRWPDDLEAIHHIKAAFHLKLADLLRKQCHLVTAATATHIIVTVDGYVFKVSVAHRREIALLKEVVTKEGLSMLRDNERSRAVQHETEHLPKLTSLLNGVHQHHSAYGPTVRLAKRWASAHLLADYMTSECIELLVAFIFLHPAPFTAPVCPQTGFLHFLSLLSHQDWEGAPLIVNFNNDLRVSDYDEIRHNFTTNRTHLPIMFVATPTDRQSSQWTQDKPTMQIFKRVVALAEESLTVLQKQLSDLPPSQDEFKQIFRPPLDPYDVIIHLRPKLLPRRHQAVDVSPEDDGLGSVTLKPSQDAKQIPVIDFDPVQCYLQELREAYDEMALFFHDTYGGDIIAVLWKRPAFKPQPFKPLQAQGRVPTPSASTSSAKTTKVVPNIEGLLQDFQTMGRGLVTSIEVRTDNWNM